MRSLLHPTAAAPGISGGLQTFIFHNNIRLLSKRSLNLMLHADDDPSPFWSDRLQLGFAPMDAVHAEFMVSVATLLRAEDTAVAAALAELDHHTREHFAEEERWMDETAFPARQCHVDEHAAVLRSLVGIGARVARGDAQAGRTFAAALQDWFPGHSDYMDAALAHWMCKLQHGAQPVVLRRRAAAAVN